MLAHTHTMLLRNSLELLGLVLNVFRVTLFSLAIFQELTNGRSSTFKCRDGHYGSSGRCVLIVVQDLNIPNLPFYLVSEGVEQSCPCFTSSYFVFKVFYESSLNLVNERDEVVEQLEVRCIYASL
mmetsp:Transcript_11784/g.19208  ORF Transcript_11784/g.19208 Transcript_11784/m.19208 type:complete len:125 (+) Transcript_11784:126-500(+)